MDDPLLIPAVDPRAVAIVAAIRGGDTGRVGALVTQHPELITAWLVEELQTHRKSENWVSNEIT